MKNIYKIGFLILGLIFLSTAHAEVCTQQHNTKEFDHVTIWKTSDHTVICHYSKCTASTCSYDSYSMLNYVPKEGPWQHTPTMAVCWSYTADDCRFAKISS